MNPRSCEICGADISKKRKHARYCGERCKKRAQRCGVARSCVDVARCVRVEPVAVPKKQRKPTVDDLVALIIEASALEGSFRFASERADHRFRPMCARIADAIGSVLDKEGLR